MKLRALLLFSCLVVQTFARKKPSGVWFTKAVTSSNRRVEVNDFTTSTTTSRTTTAAGDQGIASSRSSFSKCSCDLEAGCRCVQFYLCIGGTITDTGFGILRKRAASSCPSKTEVCCPEPSSRLTAHEEPISYPKVSKPEKCGTRREPDSARSRTSSWHPASRTYFGEFPWTVLVKGQEREPLCSGALVHSRVVATAAHCVDQIDVKHLKVIAGDWDYESRAEPVARLERQVRQMLVHEDYDDATLAHDVALLVLEQPLNPSDTVNVICLPQRDSFPFMNGRCLSTGWGNDEYSTDERKITTMKMTTWPSVQTSETTCGIVVRGTNLQEVFEPGRGQICARAKPQAEICQSDVGSPLVCPDQNAPGRYVLVGLAYGRIECGEKDAKELFVSVPGHVSWINYVISRY